MLLKYGVAWFPMVIIAVLNGALRDMGYGRFVGELPAHQISTVTLLVFFGLFIWALSRRWPIQSSGQAFAIGLMWLVLTLSFELLFGHYAMGHPWSRLLHDYDILAGRIWILVLIWITIAPSVFYRWRV